MKAAALITALLGSAIGVISTILMAKGSDAVPWKIQSYSGESDPEKASRANARLKMRWGLALLGCAFFLAALSAITGYLS